MQTFIVVYLVTVLSRSFIVDGFRMAVSKEGVTGDWYWSSMNVASIHGFYLVLIRVSNRLGRGVCTLKLHVSSFI